MSVTQTVPEDLAPATPSVKNEEPRPRGRPPKQPSADAPASAAKRDEKTYRETQAKRFAPSDFHPTGQDYEILHVTAGADWTFDDVMKPEAWASVARRVARDALSMRREKTGSTVFVHSASNAFIAFLNINSVVYDPRGGPCGLNVQVIGPAFDPRTGEACAYDLKAKRPLALKAA